MDIHRGALLPNLLTMGNGICGFSALVKLGKIRALPEGGLEGTENLAIAAYLILLGMIFDVFDGKVARLSKVDSPLGAQLDSLCDLVTFGLAPAFMVIRLNLAQDPLWQKFVWFFSLAYFLGAVLRLARFNVENSPDESAHEAFKGLPTPAAAGCVASLVIFQQYLVSFDASELRFLARLERVDVDGIQGAVESWVPFVLPVLALILGFTMVSSRLRYGHVGTKLLTRRHSFDFLVYITFGAVLLAMVPEIVLPLAFLGYLVWAPLAGIWFYLFPGQRPAVVDEPS